MLTVITINESDKWDSIVKSFDSYDVYYLSGYVKAFQLHGDGEPLLFYYDDENTRAINVVIKRDIALCEHFKGVLEPNKWFDLSTPYGYGGFWIDGNDYETIDKEYEKYCRNNEFVSEFVRFHLFSDYRKKFNGKVESHTDNVVRTLDLDIDVMLMDFEHKVRKNLKKANKAGLEIYIDESGNKIKNFLDIYYETMDRNDAKASFFFPNSFFKTINKMTGNFAYVHVIYENKVIATELLLFANENCYSFLGGTKSDYFNLRPNDFLKFEIIKWAKEKGFKRFILGGGYGENDGIFRYKKSFAPNGIYKFYVGKRVFNKESYQKLVEIRRQQQNFDEDTLYFPAYRAT